MLTITSAYTFSNKFHHLNFLLKHDFVLWKTSCHAPNLIKRNEFLAYLLYLFYTVSLSFDK